MNEPSLASVPVIVVTGISQAKVDGAKVLRKPLKLLSLLSAVETLIGSKNVGVKR